MSVHSPYFYLCLFLIRRTSPETIQTLLEWRADSVDECSRAIRDCYCCFPLAPSASPFPILISKCLHEYENTPKYRNECSSHVRMDTMVKFIVMAIVFACVKSDIIHIITNWHFRFFTLSMCEQNCDEQNVCRCHLFYPIHLHLHTHTRSRVIYWHFHRKKKHGKNHVMDTSQNKQNA